ncbi:RND family transporter [Fibrobacterota bacterium]
MYTFLCRIFHSLHQRPRTVVFFSLVVTAIALYYAYRLEVRFSLTDVLPDNFQSVKILKSVEEKFGGLGKLTIVIQSDFPSINKAAVEFLVKQLEKHPEVNILDYRKESDFFNLHKLLYIDLKDLQEIEARIETGLWTAKKKYNPMLVDLLDDEEMEETKEDNLTFRDLEEKYFPDLQKYFGTPDEKALILNIFPRFDISDLEKCRLFFDDVQTAVRQVPYGHILNISYTGEVMKSLQEEGRLISEVIDSGWLSVVTILFILLVFFFRIPAGPVLALIPMAMGIIWTMALTYFFIGYLSMVTLSLGIILLGLGLDASLHLLSRYSEERRKNLSAEIAFETITLETGPTVSMGAMTSAAAFFAITITDFKGFSEFGLIAGIGMLCTLITVLLVFPCLLILLEPLKLVSVFGPRIYNHNQFVRLPYFKWKVHLVLLAAACAFFSFRGLQQKFEYNFDRLGFPNQNARTDSIAQETGEAISSPTVVISPNQSEASRVAAHMREYKNRDTLSPTIHSVLSLSDLLPEDQSEKLAIIDNLKKIIRPQLIAGSEEPLRSNLVKLQEAWNVDSVAIDDLPDSFRKKFVGKDSRPGHFTFIFPSVDLNDGLNCIAFADDTKEIQVDENTIYQTSGIAVIYADLLNIMIPDTLKAISLALATVFLLVLLGTKSPKGTLILFIPLVLGIWWTMGVMKILDIRVNYFNLLVLPAMIGIGIDNSVHLYYRYLEEGLGSLHFVLKRTGAIICVTSLTSMAGFFGLVFSSHRGLFSMGLTAIIGICLTLIASLLFVPMVLGYFDEKKCREPS